MNAASNRKKHNPSLTLVPDTLPLHDINTELGVLGSMILENSHIPVIAGFLRAEDFFRDVHAFLFRAILDLYEEIGTVDPLLLIDRLKSRGEFSKAGGDETITVALRDTPNPANAEYYAGVIRDLSARRRLGEVAGWISGDLRLNTLNVSQVMAKARREFDLLDEKLREGRAYEALTYATLADARQLIGDTKWFWERWIPAGNLSLVAAVAGVGKTRLAADLARILWKGEPYMPDGSPNMHPEGTKTLWLMYDRNWGQTADVLESYGVPLEAILLPGSKGSPLDLPDWEDPRTFENLKRQIEEQKPGLVVIDTITYATTKNTAKAEEAKIAFDALIQVAADTGVTMLGLAHLNKAGGVLNVRIEERARAVLMLTTPDPEGQPDRRRFWVNKTAVEKPPALGVTMGPKGNVYDESPPEEAEPEPKRRGPSPAKTMKAAQWLYDQLSAGPTRLSILFDIASTDGIIGKPTKEKPNPSKSLLYDSKDRMHLIKPGWSVIDLMIDNRKHWGLLGPDQADVSGNL